MDGPSLEQKAAVYLMTQNIGQVLPGFEGWRSIATAGPMKLHVIAYGEQLTRVLGGMTIHSLANLGHLVSKTAWKLQETGQDTDVLNQNDLSYSQHRFPLETETVHVVGVAHRTAHLTQRLSFTIFVHVNGRKLMVGMGSSSLEVLPGGSHLVEVGPNGEVIPPLRPLSIEVRPAQAHPAAPPSAPPSPTCSILAPSDAPPPSPWPLSPIGSPSRGESSQQNEARNVSTFMLVNVTDSNTTKNEIILEKLRDIGVLPENIRSEPLPIKPRYRRVYFFDTKNGDDARKIEAIIMPKEWPSKFAIHALQANEPFFWTALSSTDIIKAMLLSQKIMKSGEMVSTDLQLEDVLRDKGYIGDVLNDDEVVQEVIGGLNRVGKGIFKQEIHQQVEE